MMRLGAPATPHHADLAAAGNPTGDTTTADSRRVDLLTTRRDSASERTEEPRPWARARGIRVLSTAFLLVYLVVSLSRYAQYLSTGYDLGIFDQAVRAYAHFRAPISAVKAPGFNVLGDHFSPILVLLAPLYWIWDNPCMLLIAQAVLVACSIPIVYRFTLRRDVSERYALLIAGVYAAGWPIEAMLNFDFHEIAFAVPMLAAALDALDRRDYRKMLVWCALLLLVKEDMGLIVSSIGVLALLASGFRRTSWRRPAPLSRATKGGLAALLLGLVAYYVTTTIALPALAPDKHFAYWNYSSLGSNLPHALTTIVTRPWHAVWVFFTPVLKTSTLLFLLVPLAMIPLRSRYMVVAGVLLAERFFNDREQLWSPIYHYNALPWLVLVLAFVDGAARLGLFRRTKRAQRRRAWVAGWLIFTQFLALQTITSVEQKAGSGSGVVQRLLSWDNPAVRNRAAAVRYVPSNVCVEADDFLIPYLTSKDYTTLPEAAGISPDYILLDMARTYVGPQQNFVAGENGPTPASVLAQATTAGFVRVFTRGTVIILRSPSFHGPSQACSPLGPGR